MRRTIIAANFNSCQKVTTESLLQLWTTWLKLAYVVEKDFKFHYDDETLSWRIHILASEAMVAKPSVINRSDLDKPVTKKHGQGSIIPQACCPEVIIMKKNRCGFANEKHITPEKLAEKVIAILQKTRG